MYWLTAADGYPWSASTHWALAWSGVLPELPERLWPIWGYFVQVFDGHYILLSACSAALAAAVLATVVNHRCGWRVALGTTIVFVFWPSVWNAAVTGDRRASLLAVGALALVAVDRFARIIWRKALAFLPCSRVAAWIYLSASGIFICASATFHDYAIGEDASEHANEVLKGTDGKWLVMGGIVNDQLYAAVRDRKLDVQLVDMRSDDLYRTQLVQRVRRAFTNDVELVSAAEIGPHAFVAAGRKRFPDLFVMTDVDRTTEKLAKARPEGWKFKTPSVRRLVEWNNEMVRAMEDGETTKAGRIARTILSVPNWQGFVPANAILGTLTGMEGDLIASERFFRKIVEAKADIPPVACNDFAETLRRLGKFNEAETYARKAVAASDRRNWRVRLTLIQILHDAGKNRDEVEKLIRTTLPDVPKEVQPRFLALQPNRFL